MLSYLSYIGMPFISVCSSYAQYPDAESLLGRLGIKIDKDGKLVADGTGGCLPDAFAGLLAVSTTEKLTQLCGNEMALEEGRWNNHCILDTYKPWFAKKMGIIPNEADLGRVGDLVRSREFLTGVFGEDFVSEFLGTVAESSEKVYTNLTSCIDFQEYRCLCEELRTLERKLDELERKNSIVKNYLLCSKAYLERQEKIKSQIAKCEEVLKRYVPRNGRSRSLWEKWSVFDTISYNSDQKEVSLAVEGFLKELKRVPGLQKYNNEHPVWIAFSEVQALLPEYLRSCSLFEEASIKKLGKEEEEEKKVRNEIKKLFEGYRKRFAGKEYLTNEEGEKIPISTEPVTVDIRIYQYHYEDKDGARKLHGEDWKQCVDDLDIELRLTIDTRTRKLLSAFCERFVVNGQVVTYFGTNGLRIFKSEQSQGFIEEKK